MTQTGADLESGDTQASSGDALSESEAYGRVRAQGDNPTELKEANRTNAMMKKTKLNRKLGKLQKYCQLKVL